MAANQTPLPCPFCGAVLVRKTPLEGPGYWRHPGNECRVQPAQQEPVGTVRDLFTQTAWENLDVVGSTKVYLDSPPAQRKPLTDEQIWKFWWSRPEVPEGEDDSMEAEFVAAVRAVLAAHGIKENA